MFYNIVKIFTKKINIKIQDHFDMRVCFKFWDSVQVKHNANVQKKKNYRLEYTYDNF